MCKSEFQKMCEEILYNDERWFFATVRTHVASSPEFEGRRNRQTLHELLTERSGSRLLQEMEDAAPAGSNFAKQVEYLKIVLENSPKQFFLLATQAAYESRTFIGDIEESKDFRE